MKKEEVCQGMVCMIGYHPVLVWKMNDEDLEIYDMYDGDTETVKYDDIYPANQWGHFFDEYNSSIFTKMKNK